MVLFAAIRERLCRGGCARPFVVTRALITAGLMSSGLMGFSGGLVKL